jgi:hypothetical protein
MKTRRYAALAVLAAACFAPALLAQPAPTLESLKATYDKAKKEIDVAHERQKTDALAAYGRAVEENMLAYQKKGDLDTYLLLEKAKKDAEGGTPVPEPSDGLHAGLVQPVAGYRKLLAAADAERSRRLTTLQTQYATSLQEQIKRLMKQEKIDDAMKVKEELDRIKAERGGSAAAEPATPTPTPAATPAPAPATPAAKEKEKDEYPNIAGSWKEEGGGTYVVSQNGPYWTAKCSFTHPRFGEVKSEITKGSVTKDLKIEGELRFFKAPSTLRQQQGKRTGTISDDGQTIKFTYSRAGGDADDEATWTRQAK